MEPKSQEAPDVTEDDLRGWFAELENPDVPGFQDKASALEWLEYLRHED
jgi:hypothetical protein